MTPDMERIGKILVKAEGGCWHEWYKVEWHSRCKKCPIDVLTSTLERNGYHPDFSQWENFGRLLKIAGKRRIGVKFFPNSTASKDINMLIIDGTTCRDWTLDNIDQIPIFVATELARIVEKEEKV